MPKGFVIYFGGRTGSTFLIERLRGHPDIKAFGEVFGTPQLAGEDQSAERQKWFVEEKMGVHRRGAANPAPKSVGLKIQIHVGKSQILEPEAFQEQIKNYDMVHFHLTRKNIVKQAVSSIRARAFKELTTQELGHGYANVRKDFAAKVNSSSIGPLEIEPARLAQMVDGIQRSEQAVAEYIDGFDRIERFTYEDLIADKTKFLNWFCEQIEVGPHEWSSEEEVLKLTKGDLRQSILNIDELNEHFKDDEIGTMLQEEQSLRA